MHTIQMCTNEIFRYLVKQITKCINPNHTIYITVRTCSKTRYQHRCTNDSYDTVLAVGCLLVVVPSQNSDALSSRRHLLLGSQQPRHRHPCHVLPRSAKSRCQRAGADVEDEVPRGPVAINCSASAAATTSSSLSAAARQVSIGTGFVSVFSSPSRQRIASTIVSRLPLRGVDDENGTELVPRLRCCETSVRIYSDDMRRSRSSCRCRSAICRRRTSTTGPSADSSPRSTLGESIPAIPSSDDSVSSLRRLDMVAEAAEMLDNLVKLSSSSSISQMSRPSARSRRVRRSLHAIRYERSLSRE